MMSTAIYSLNSVGVCMYTSVSVVHSLSLFVCVCFCVCVCVFVFVFVFAFVVANVSLFVSRVL